MGTVAEPLTPVTWVGDMSGYLRILDQTRLPHVIEERTCRDLEGVLESIAQLRVRGAPAIGVAGAYGLILGLQETASSPLATFREKLREQRDRLVACRPTAVNLALYLARLDAHVAGLDPESSGADALRAMLAEVRRIQEENEAACRAMAAFGAARIQDGWGLLTHCNTGGLATAGVGTALGVIQHAHDSGKRIRVFADETRPLLQGARLTTFELMRAGVDVTLICDSAAAHVMRQGKVQAVLVGADRIARNGDAANKIGTFGLAVLAHAFGIPFWVVAPTTTIDPDLASGEPIPIEERSPAEVTHGSGTATAPDGVRVFNPAFDVTPHRYVTAIVTEKGVLEPPFEETIADALEPG